ncbi:hypothetical protein HHK36_026023 [Tetracentron sinense]|uniref:Uncharacterized protein n=1 Tax=Tetracentron sinense TaxID=13715 RepID=A0A835D6Y9_TETSI|nr:hypothetical protein HHK36_026023 [Tetracentron sinense]
MAEALVSFFLEKLLDGIGREAISLDEVNEQINSLRVELGFMLSFLEDADGKLKQNERARVWVNQVRDVAYDVEDVIDEFMFKVESQRRRSVGVTGSFRSTVGRFKKLKTLREVGNRIEKIKRMVEEISVNRSKYGIEILELGESSSRISYDPRWKSYMLEEVDAVGIEDDAKMLVRQLVEGETRLSVISIVGMGGLGKTTLAKKVYINTGVCQHFQCRAWISLSQEYRVREVLDAIIKQVRVLEEWEKEKLREMNEQELRMEVSACLKERRYLVVVDNIWSIEAWICLENVFPDGMKGSRVILTTRNKEIAQYADVKSTPYELQLLNEENCWELFCRKAFPKSNRNICLSPDLEHIGREIVAKCGGLPLAVVALGGFLSRIEKLPSEWEKVLKQINRKFEGQSEISTILALSYNDLPYYLKSCFLYFGVFPEDFEIPSRKLIHLWVAEGLVEQRGDKTMEEIAQDYLEELINRGMVQASKRRHNGEIKSCRIHDLLRDLSISEAKENKFLDVQRSVDFGSPVRACRLTIHGSIERYISPNHLIPHLRSLLLFIPESDVDGLGKKLWSFIFSGFRLLRVLDLTCVTTTKLSKEVGKMIHLRYLGLRSFIHTLPFTISNLANLQTLDIKPPFPSNIQQFIPNSISKMSQLRHLYVGQGQMCGASKLNGLRNLQTLLMICAGSWIEEGLVELTNLRNLGICDIALDSHKEALFESIVKLDRIESLCLLAKDDNTLLTLMLSNHVHLYKLRLFGRLEKVPDVHELPPNLTYLSLQGSHLMQDPIATLEKLPHLRYLALVKNTYMGTRMVFTSSGFPRLEELQVAFLPELEEWQIEKGAMLRLRCLVIHGCKNLKTLPEKLGNMPELEELKLENMPQEFNERILGGEFRRMHAGITKVSVKTKFAERLITIISCVSSGNSGVGELNRNLFIARD